MKAPGGKFGRKKEEAIAALLTQRNIEEAAKAVGIGANTLLRWLKVPEFDAAYRGARRAAFRQSVARLQQASGAAVSTLLKIMVDTSAPHSTRVRAADSVLTTRRKPLKSKTSRRGCQNWSARLSWRSLSEVTDDRSTA